MTQMLERIERAMAQTMLNNGLMVSEEMYTALALTTLRALSEPTEEMLMAGSDAGDYDPDYGMEYADPEKTWKAMLDAALGGTKGGRVQA